jgi:hypothetical protein
VVLVGLERATTRLFGLPCSHVIPAPRHARRCSRRGHLGVQLLFTKADNDHIGFDVKDLKAFIKTLDGHNVKFDRPYTVSEAGIGIAFFIDPWGANIDINERPPQ